MSRLRKHCRCGMYRLDPFIGTYATPGETHTREVCTIDSHRLRKMCTPWMPKSVGYLPSKRRANK